MEASCSRYAYWRLKISADMIIIDEGTAVDPTSRPSSRSSYSEPTTGVLQQGTENPRSPNTMAWEQIAGRKRKRGGPSAKSRLHTQEIADLQEKLDVKLADRTSKDAEPTRNTRLRNKMTITSSTHEHRDTLVPEMQKPSKANRTFSERGELRMSNNSASEHSTTSRNCSVPLIGNPSDEADVDLLASSQLTNEAFGDEAISGLGQLGYHESGEAYWATSRRTRKKGIPNTRNSIAPSGHLQEPLVYEFESRPKRKSLTTSSNAQQRSLKAYFQPREGQSKSSPISRHRQESRPTAQIDQFPDNATSEEYAPPDGDTSAQSDYTPPGSPAMARRNDAYPPIPNQRALINREDLPSSGRFSKEEKMLLEAVAKSFRSRKGLSEEQFNELVRQPINIVTKDLWKELQAALPKRGARFVQRFCRRTWHKFPSGTDQWDEDIDAALRAAYAEHPDKWTLISAKVGRLPGACRDRWKTHVVCVGKRMNEWSSGEEDNLITAVEECKTLITAAKATLTTQQQAEAAELDDDGWENFLNFKSISQKVGTRTEIQCRSKWAKMKTRKAKPTARSKSKSESLPSAMSQGAVAAWVDTQDPQKRQEMSLDGREETQALQESPLNGREGTPNPPESPPARREEDAANNVELMLAGDVYKILLEVIDTRPEHESSIDWQRIKKLYPRTNWTIRARKVALQKLRAYVDEKETFRKTLLAMKAYIEEQSGDAVHMRYFEGSQKEAQGKKMPQIYDELRDDYIKTINLPNTQAWLNGGQTSNRDDDEGVDNSSPEVAAAEALASLSKSTNQHQESDRDSVFGTSPSDSVSSASVRLGQSSWIGINGSKARKRR